MNTGPSGKLAAAFINSKLTPLIIIASLLLGLFAVMKTPREEEPQIIVPMADVIVSMPGSTSAEVERRVTSPMEKLIWEVPGVEYVYSTSMPGQSMVIVRFYVGENQEAAFVRLREKLQSHFDIIPPGASQPIIKPRSIDDVPILAVTLHSRRLDDYLLRQIAARVEDTIKQTPNVSETHIIGGRRREVRIELDRARLEAWGLSIDAVGMAVDAHNQRAQTSGMDTQDERQAVTSGSHLRNVHQMHELVVAAPEGRPVRLGDIASIQDGPEEAKQYVLFGSGGDHVTRPTEPAVTISVAKRQGTNAIDVAHAVMARVEALRGRVIPSDVTITITRNYGETAAEKSGELLFHMMIAVVSVTILIGIALGRREALVVAVAIPVTLALTLLVFYLVGYTLNRITLFALIFSIGILVDDAIVVVENIVRHMRMPANQTRSRLQVAIEAVDEVGNPTILATIAVIAAILPMAFVGGLMGPYMRPIPVGATAAMIFSLLVAFIVTPWAAVRLLGRTPHGSAHADHGDHEAAPDDLMTRLYKRIMDPLLHRRSVRFGFLAGVALLLVAAMSLVPLGAVIVKMLPFDNKSEFQVIVDMPTGASLEQTLAAARSLAVRIAREPEVDNYQIYTGTAAPYNFNGLVRHYFDRRMPWQGDIQVNLTPKHNRKAQSHDIVRRIRPDVERLGKELGVRVKIAEVPPGPPVLQTLVAEIYGPTPETREAVAARVKQVFHSTEGVTDVDWYRDDHRPSWNLAVDMEKAALSGVDVGTVNRTIQAVLGAASFGLLHDTLAHEDVPITLRLPRSQRATLSDLTQYTVPSRTGRLVPLSELVRPVDETPDTAIYHKNLMPVIYVTGDVSGRRESPVYAILAMNRQIGQFRLEDGGGLNVLSTRLPTSDARPEMKWDGEWHISYEVFRDLGIAFAAVLVLIYILVVAWFQSFRIPLVIMAPIPLTLVGILPAHAAMGAFFTATSMIGFIAGAGIIVRNSIILVDFIELRMRHGLPLDQAVIDAGATRFRPMLLTAAAVIVGSAVILFDPIFQGLAIALMAGEIASTLLSRFAVPVLYFMLKQGRAVTIEGGEAV